MSEIIVKQEKKSKTIAQGNFIVRSHLSFGTVEARIFTYMLAGIHKDDEDFKPIEIPMNLITSNTGGTAYEMVTNACKNLMTKYIEASETDRKRGTKFYSFVDSLGIDKGSSLITGIFSHSIRPYLIQLKEHYTIAEIEQLLELKTGTSHRLYWLLKSYETLGVYEETVDELKNRLCGKKVKYDRYYDFKKNVLLPAIAEIQKTEETPGNPIAFEFIEIKAGKKVNSIKFVFDGHAKQLAAERKANKGKYPKKNTAQQGLLFGNDQPKQKYKPVAPAKQNLKATSKISLQDLQEMHKGDFDSAIAAREKDGWYWDKAKTFMYKD
ncbi:replication initiation protein [Pontibacter sp. 13R65]|uniref:replication initiation protein n=1 Tax=Pontibacter sp. 13R65 TaxID=3127458 RepID=UPI00301B7687